MTDLDHLMELRAKASPVPWMPGWIGNGPTSQANSELIAASVNAIEPLVRELKDARAEVAELKRVRDAEHKERDHMWQERKQLRYEIEQLRHDDERAATAVEYFMDQAAQARRGAFEEAAAVCREAALARAPLLSGIERKIEALASAPTTAEPGTLAADLNAAREEVARLRGERDRANRSANVMDGLREDAEQQCDALQKAGGELYALWSELREVSFIEDRDEWATWSYGLSMRVDKSRIEWRRATRAALSAQSDAARAREGKPTP